MRSGLSSFVSFLLILIIALLAYFLGRKNGTVTIDHIANNATFIKEIAELSSLEAQGTASIKSSNIANDGSFSDSFRKMFLEKTVNITVPYVAKYGIDLSQQNITIEEKNKQVNVVLPNPKLLSYELKIDRADAMTRKGLFEPGGEEHFTNVEKKLYTQSRSQMERNTTYIQQSKDKITKIIQSYYAPMNFKVEVVFKDELKSSVIDTRN